MIIGNTTYEGPPRRGQTFSAERSPALYREAARSLFSSDDETSPPFA